MIRRFGLVLRACLRRNRPRPSGAAGRHGRPHLQAGHRALYARRIVDKASKDLAAVAEILGENRYLLGTDRPTSFDAVVFGMTILVYQLREMHPRLTDYARSLPNLHSTSAICLPSSSPTSIATSRFIAWSLRIPGFYLKETAHGQTSVRLTPCQRFARVLSPPRRPRHFYKPDRRKECRCSQHPGCS